MNDLLRKQWKFCELLGKLLVFATSKGWAFTLADGYRADGKGHIKGSLHYSRLAQDLNLFINGKWIQDGGHPAWAELGEYWESLGGAWGGRFPIVDSNHFSLEHAGRK